ncbi:hypothetical protein SK224_05400 [Microbacterium sp. BG28]|uniref:hypothetical protein n=1 Tax=Microbacterium sp. BG28 TaxID=3097356 RepID=UPI002A5A2C78|nr:hypothetical protein [Microbacterium sp. BG28]MDY0828560.1 hypothetical protein [Microbacterium sp. BG28]
MRRDTVSAYRRRARDTELKVDQSVAAVQAERDADWQARKAAAQQATTAERDRTPPSRAELVGATLVRDRYGWHRIAKVNRTTVDVYIGPGVTKRLQVDRVLEASSSP